MKENVGTIDRTVRSIVGPALVILGYTKWGGKKGRLPGLAAIVGGTALIESAITRVCPLNALFGIDTREQPILEDSLMSEIGEEIQAEINAGEFVDGLR